MPDIGSNDKLFSSIMQKSKLTMPFSDFEDKVMQLITEETIRKGAILKNIKLSSLFFLLGTGFGLATSMILSGMRISFMHISPENILLLFQATFVFAFLMQLDKIIRMIKELKAGKMHWFY